MAVTASIILYEYLCRYTAVNFKKGFVHDKTRKTPVEMAMIGTMIIPAILHLAMGITMIRFSLLYLSIFLVFSRWHIVSLAIILSTMAVI